MTDLVPTITNLTPAAPIIIVIDPATGLGKSGPLTLHYSVTNTLWQAGDPPVPFMALLQATNLPYHVVGGTPTVQKNETLTLANGNFDFDFVLETIAQFVGGSFPVTLRLCVYDLSKGPGSQKCHEQHYQVTLQ